MKKKKFEQAQIEIIDYPLTDVLTGSEESEEEDNLFVIGDWED